MKITLVNQDAKREKYTLKNSPVNVSTSKDFNRSVLSAAHVVSNPLCGKNADRHERIDWSATMHYRHYLASLGLGIAEAMDTAQRGMGLDWKNALKLIEMTQKEIDSVPVFHGIGTDHLNPENTHNIDDVYDAYMTQLNAVQNLNGRCIMMASRALVKAAGGAEDFIELYRRVLINADQPVILHWLGDVFDPHLKNYWGKDSQNSYYPAMDICLQVIEENHTKVDGIKISLLQKEYEINMRRRLPNSVKMYTGDDFNYPELIAGDEDVYSHALLGIFDAIAPAANAALAALAKNDMSLYYDIINPTLPLSRCIFESPTQYYKAGVVFLAWLNGHQTHFTMLAEMQSSRSILHYCQLFKLADEAGVLIKPDIAIQRMDQLLKLYGI